MKQIKKICACWCRTCAALGKIHLIDKCLIVFMVVLLVQSAYNLFSGDAAATDNNSIDIIVRTSAAGIFGYFISANFIKNFSAEEKEEKEAEKEGPPTAAVSDGNQGARNRIGFADPDAPNEAEMTRGYARAEEKKDEMNANHLQILIAAGIGLFCLVVLILLRNLTGCGDADSTFSSSTVAQFRDFVSGCVGFLIGCPTTKTDK